jgi:hypothetical protein
VEKEAMQLIAVPNEQEDGCTQVQDHEVGPAVEVEEEAGTYVAYGCDVVCNDEQNCQEPVDPVRSVGQQFGHVEESSEESVPF